MAKVELSLLIEVRRSAWPLVAQFVLPARDDGADAAPAAVAADPGRTVGLVAKELVRFLRRACLDRHDLHHLTAPRCPNWAAVRDLFVYSVLPHRTTEENPLIA